MNLVPFTWRPVCTPEKVPFLTSRSGVPPSIRYGFSRINFYTLNSPIFLIFF